MKFKVFRIRLEDGYREQDEAALNEFLDGINVTQVFASVVQDAWSVLVSYDEAQGDKPKQNDEKLTTTLSTEERTLYEALLQWRNEKAKQEGIAAYMVAHSESLRQVVKLGVRTRDELLKVKGFRERRVRKYGDDILHILNGGADKTDNKPLYLDF